jgi:signal transduction histidine kinase
VIGDIQRDHRRLWPLAGVLLALLCGAAGLMLNLLLDWPAMPAAGLLVGIVTIPVAIALGRSRRWGDWAPVVLTRMIVAGGLVMLVGFTYVIVVIGLDGIPDESERTILALSMGAAAVVALLVAPARHWLLDWANQRIYGEVQSPEDALRAFGNRMSRALPMDELLLQLVETLKKSLDLSQAEIWTGTDGLLTLAASVPDRTGEPLNLGEKELAVAARAHAQGGSWLEVWIPELLDGREDDVVRAVSVAHLGKLLGLIVLTRPAMGQPFSEDEDTALVELARQLGLALHNVSLDSALQASLDELAARNRELVASRARIVAAADESRQVIERNLHDGAQQHLVALAVKTGLIRTMMGADPEKAELLVDELSDDIKVTLGELRELAHGIYPPLLREQGLPRALESVASRAVLPTEVDVAEIGRFPRDLEAAIYFCCAEAVQNAGKYAGESASVTIWVGAEEGSLLFRVSDDGAGFDPDGARHGQGFVNMADRLGAFGGVLQVESEPGQGSVISGRIPLDHEAAGSRETAS